jgi:hypothetical protein
VLAGRDPQVQAALRVVDQEQRVGVVSRIPERQHQELAGMADEGRQLLVRHVDPEANQRLEPRMDEPLVRLLPAGLASEHLANQWNRLLDLVAGDDVAAPGADLRIGRGEATLRLLEERTA